jgi:hypothetical protein
MTKQGKYGGGYVGPGAALEFLRRYIAADDAADLELRDAELSDGTILMSCTVADYTAALTPFEMRAVADSAESALVKFPEEPEARGLPNLILGMREGARRLEQLRAMLAAPAPPASS